VTRWIALALAALTLVCACTLTLVLRPDVKHRVSAMRYDHYSLLATIEDILGVPRLANAATATPTRDLIG
jgi:hypothetical protein